MKKCPHCGTEATEEAVFCKSCGGKLSAQMGPGELPAQVSGKATASLILGIFFFVLPAAVLAIVFGHISRGEIKRSGGRLTGAGRALAGLILGYFGVAALPLIIIIIVAAIAIPNLLRSKMAANQASAVASLRVISTGAATYASSHGSYPRSLADLGPESGDAAPGQEGLIGKALALGAKSGYVFAYRVTRVDPQGRVAGFDVHADPAAQGSTGQSHYFVDETGVIRYDEEKPASESSRPIGWAAPRPAGKDTPLTRSRHKPSRRIPAEVAAVNGQVKPAWLLGQQASKASSKADVRHAGLANPMAARSRPFL